MFYLKMREKPLEESKSEGAPTTVLKLFPERIFQCPTCGVTLEREAVGTRLDQCDAASIELHYSFAGKGLAVFHNLSAVEGMQVSSKRIVKKLLRWIDWIRSRGEGLDSLPDSRRFESCLMETTPRDLAVSWIHGDLKPEHVFVHDGEISLIDRDALKKGFILLDPANLVNHLEWEQQNSEIRIGAFLKAYAKGIRMDVADAFRFARLCAAIRTVRNRISENGTGNRDAIQKPLASVSELWTEMASQRMRKK